MQHYYAFERHIALKIVCFNCSIMPTEKIYYTQHREAGQMERQKGEGVTHDIRPYLGHYLEVRIVDDGNYDAQTDYEESFVEYNIIRRHRPLLSSNMPGTDRAWH